MGQGDGRSQQTKALRKHMWILDAILNSSRTRVPWSYVGGRARVAWLATRRLGRYSRCRWVSLNPLGYFSPNPNKRSMLMCANRINAR